MPHTALTLNELLTQAVAQHASDLHLSAGLAPKVRAQGVLTPLQGPTTSHQLAHEALQRMLTDLMDEAQHAQFMQGHEVDFAFAVPELGRFRANAFMQQHGCGAVMRHIPSGAPTLAALHAPRVLPDLL